MSVQALTYVVPIVTLPFLARVLGRAHWGELALAEAYATYVSLLLEYGFGFSATRDIAHARNEGHIRSAKLSAVMGAQILLAILSLIVTAIVFLTVPAVANLRSFLALALFLAVTRSSFPIWYFQGMERMRYIAVSNAVVSVASAAAIFIMVRSTNDTFVPLRIRAIAAAISSLAAYGVLSFETPLRLPHLGPSLRALWDGWSLFMFRSAVSLYTTANVLLLGLLLPASGVAIYAGPEKLLKAAMTAIGPITQTFYPRISYQLKHAPLLARATVRASAFLSVGGAILVGIIMFTAAPWLVRILLGRGFESSINVLRLMSVLPAIIAANVVLGIQWLLPLRLEKEYTGITLFAGVVNILLAVVLVPRYQAIGMTLSVIVAEACVTTGIFLILRHRKRNTAIPTEPALPSYS